MTPVSLSVIPAREKSIIRLAQPSTIMYEARFSLSTDTDT